MIIRKDETHRFDNSDTCTVLEYAFGNTKLGLAQVIINGRYPETGSAMNLESCMIYLVISGQGSIHYDQKNYEIQQGDAFFFEKEKSYWVQGRDLLVAVINAPTWTLEQYKHIE